MKWWQIVWLAIVMVWGNVLFGILAFSFFTGGRLTHDLQELVLFCLAFFTLPAAGTYLACAGVAWLVPRLWRGAVRRVRARRASARLAAARPVRPASA